MKIVLLVILFFSIIALCVLNYKSDRLHRKLVESFKEEEDSTIELLSEEDKTLYFSIIDTYELLLDRDPYEDELNLAFNDIKTKKSDLMKLHNKLKTSPEYRRLNDLQSNEAYAATDTHNDVQDYDAVVKVLKDTMPLVEHTEDPVHVEFLVMKYRSMEKDKDKLAEYLRKTPEYQDYLEIEKTLEKTKKSDDKNKQAKEEGEDSVNLLDKKNNVEFKISRPNLNSKTLKTAKKETKEFVDLIQEKLKKDNKMDEDEKSCDFYKQFQKLNGETMLSDVQKKRNLDQLKYHCDMSKMYANTDSNLVLLPDQKWSVPQQHPPVCTSQNNCSINDTYSQTALIGTLLNDAEFNSKLLPSFEYKEKP